MSKPTMTNDEHLYMKRPEIRAASKCALEITDHWRDRIVRKSSSESFTSIINAPLPPEFGDHVAALKAISALDLLRIAVHSRNVFTGRINSV